MECALRLEHEPPINELVKRFRRAFGRWGLELKRQYRDGCLVAGLWVCEVAGGDRFLILQSCSGNQSLLLNRAVQVRCSYV